MSTVSKWLRNRRLDVDAAVLGLLLALALIPVRFVASQIYILTIPIVLGVGCILYLFATRSERATVNAMPTFSRTVGMLLPSLVLFGTALLALLARLQAERTRLFYGVTGVVGTLLILQILFTDEKEFNPRLLLVEIVALATVIRFSALYTTPSLIGIDIFTHIEALTRSVYEQHTVYAMEGNKHLAAPFYHVLVAGSAMLFDVSLQDALYLTVGVAMPISVVFVYTATKQLAPTRWAVLAAMLFSIGDYVMEWGIHLIPTSHGLVFFLAVVYLLVRVMQTDYGARDFGMLVFFSIAAILTHQVSTFIMLVVLGSGLVAQLLLSLSLFQSPRSRGHQSMGTVNLAGLVAFDMGLITFMWSFTPYNGDSFLETILLYLAQTVESSMGFGNLVTKTQNPKATPLPPPTFTEQLASYINVTGYLLLLCLTVVGCLYVIRRERLQHSAATLFVSAALMTVFTLGLPLFGIRNFIPNRWFAFLYAPMAIIGAIGLWYLARSLDPRVVVACMVVLAVVYPPMMMFARDGTIESPPFPDHQERLAYTESEMAAVDSIGAMTGSPNSMNLSDKHVLRTDHPYDKVFERTGAYPSETANITKGNRSRHGVVVYREAQSTRATYFQDQWGRGRIRFIQKSRLCRPGQSIIYSNGDVSMCVNRTL